MERDGDALRTVSSDALWSRLVRYALLWSVAQ
jgi:hypothetical protein